MKFSALLLALLCVPAWAQNTITVRVTDTKKAPIANATVALRIWGEKSYREETLQTGDDGALKFELQQSLDPKKPVGNVTAYAPGFSLQSHAIDAATLDFALPPGMTWRGKVVDEAEKPVAGAKIQVGVMRAKGASREDYIYPSGKKLSEIYSATAGADGGFEIAGLPVGGTFSYSATAPRFAAISGQDLNAETPATLVLKPGALLSGQLLGLNGKPIPKTRVYARSSDRMSVGGGDGETDDEGKFTIDNLSAGTYNVGASIPDDADYLVPAQKNVLAQVGQTNPVPTLQAVETLVVKGLVRDAATQKPLQGAQIGGIFGPDGGGDTRSQSELTGADGRFSVRVLPGQNTFQFWTTPDAYVSSGIQQTLNVDEKTPDVIFDLPAKPVLTGVIVNEKNQPVQAQLRVWGGFQENIQSDAQGKWSYEPESLRTVNLAGGDSDAGYYEITSGANLEVPSKELYVVQVELRPWHTLRGRVVAPDGTPRAGVEVKADFYFKAGDNGLLDSSLTATTDTNGNYQFDRIRAGEKPSEMARGLKITIKAAGYSFVEGGEIAADGANWKASDIVLTALDRKIEGTTSPGARVVAAGRDAVADATGQFSFKNLPAGAVTVYAARDGNFGSAIAADDAPIKIELAPMKAQTTDVELGRDAWREIINETGNDDKFYARSWVLGQLNAAEGETFAQLQGAAQEPPTPNHDYSLYTQLMKWAPKLGADNRSGQIESVARGIQDPEVRLSAWLDAAIAVGDDKAVSERALSVADEIMARTATDIQSREWNLYRVAVATEQARGEAAGAAALDKAIALTLKSHGPKNYTKDGYYTTGRDGSLASAAEIVAQGNLALLQHLLVNISPEVGDDVAALGKAIPVVARKRGVEAALALLEQLAQKPTPDFGNDNDHSMQNVPQYAFDVSARRIAPLLAAKDPASALELVRRISANSDRARALALVAPFQTPAVAADLWREAVTIGDVNATPRFAAQAFESDPKLGRELFELARVRGANSDNYNRSGFWPPYAFYLARADASAARLELEREWSSRLASNDGQSLAPIARAMSAADGSRALEMARQIPRGEDNFWSLEVRRKIGQYLIADKAERRDWPFDRWGATDTWSPGDEEW